MVVLDLCISYHAEEERRDESANVKVCPWNAAGFAIDLDAHSDQRGQR